MRIEVESTTPHDQTTALATASSSALAVDLSADQAGAGRGVTAEQLLALSLAASLSSTIHQQALATRTELTRVHVRVLADFPDAPEAPADRSAKPTPPTSFAYEIELTGNARTDRLDGLITHADRTAAVAIFLRRSSEVRLAKSTTRSDFPRRTLDEALAVCRFMERWPGTWWVAGGWAIDLWLGLATREHEDIEIAVPRADQAALQPLVADWRAFTPRDHRWSPLEPGELLQPPASMWQFRRAPHTADTVQHMPPRWEFVLSDVEDGHWTFPFDPSLRLPLDRVIVHSPLGPPVAAPELVLLLKAFNHPPRPKDEHDLLFVRDRLSPEQLDFLRSHIERLLPSHRWLRLLP